MIDLSLARFAPMSAVAAGLFTIAWIVLGQISTGFTIFGTHVAPYNATAQSISGLGLGNTALAMNAVFVISALLLAAGIIGSMTSFSTLSAADRIVICFILLLSPIGMATCGLFNLEHFIPHLIGFVLAMGAPVLGFPLLGWRLGSDMSHTVVARILIAAGPVTLALLVAYFWSFDPETSGRGLGISGLVQRILATEVLCVFALFGLSGGNGAAT